MASPDTDELQTGTPEQRTEPLAAGAGAGAAEGPGGPAEVQQTEPLAAQPAAGVQEAAPAAGAGGRERAESAVTEAQETEPLATQSLESEPAEAQTVPQERVEPERVEPAEQPAEPEKPGGRWWRGFTGSLAAGLAVLALGVLVVGGIDLYTGAPGPGPALLIGHPVAAVLALVAQRVADRRNGVTAAGAGVAVVLFAVSALTLFWLT